MMMLEMVSNATRKIRLEQRESRGACQGCRTHFDVEARATMTRMSDCGPCIIFYDQVCKLR